MMVYPDQKIHELTAENTALRQALEDIASAHMLWHGGIGPRLRSQLEDFIQQLQEMASEALKATRHAHKLPTEQTVEIPKDDPAQPQGRSRPIPKSN